jgi:phosphoglucomutase
VLAANEVVALIDAADRYTPPPRSATPSCPSTAAAAQVTFLLACGRPGDGIVVTPSHNPRATAASSTTRPHGGPGRQRCHLRDRQAGNEILRGRIRR